MNNTKDECDTFNTFFVNVANNIGKDVIFDGNSHPSILKIKNNTQHNTLFDFKPTDVDTVSTKAFDCLPHDILLCKLSAYGLSPKSVELRRNYLTGCNQLIKLQGDLSSWADIQKGAPQRSILGPLLFKIFINDIFYFIEYGTLHNYADDSTLSYVDDNYEKLIDILEKESSIVRLVQIQLYPG